jgi:hypothetical protein
VTEEVVRLLDAVRKRIGDAQAQANSYEEVLNHSDEQWGPLEELEQQESSKLEHTLTQAYRTMCVFLERAGLNLALADLKEEWNSYKDGLSELKDWDDEPEYKYSPALIFLNNQLRVFEALENDLTAEQPQIEIVRRIVKNTAQVVALAPAPPASEADIQRALHAHLRVGFPDARREAAVAQPTKTYKPDIAIDSLRTAIEVKFADSEEKAKVALGGLYEDMKGYAGDRAYTTFTAVVFMNDAYISQDVLDAEAARVGVLKDWRIYVAVGTSANKLKKAAKIQQPV